MTLHNPDPIWAHVEDRQARFVALSDQIWETPETNFAEYRSAAEHAAMLHDEGFRVTEGLAGMPTALMGEAGAGGPVIAFLGEYDALPNLSQQAGVAERRPVSPGVPGMAVATTFWVRAPCLRRRP